MQPQVGIIMGSDSDLPIMQAAADILKYFEIDFELTIVSAHRTPIRMVNYAQTAKERGLKVIIAGAGGAAHLDSVLSILQMPNGVPVATVALNAAKNAGILAAQMIGAFDEAVNKRVSDYKVQLSDEVLQKVNKLKSEGWQNTFS
jgi:5-(carboxyamino)imidazole ribonucleotide mutase